MSKRLEEIKQEIASEASYESWSKFMFINNRNTIAVENAMNEVSNRYAREVAQASLEIASNLPINLYDDEWHLEKLKESITNPDNIVLYV